MIESAIVAQRRRRELEYQSTRVASVLACFAFLLTFSNSRDLIADAPEGTSLGTQTPPTIGRLTSAWERYSKDFGEIGCRIESQTSTGSSAKTLKATSGFKNTLRIFENGYVNEKSRRRIVNDNEVEVLEIAGVNDNYSFVLKREGQESLELVQVNADLPSEDLLKSSRGGKIGLIYITWPFHTTMPELQLPELFKDPSFRLISIEPVGDGDWQMNFNCDIQKGALRMWGPATLQLMGAPYYLPLKLTANGSDANLKGTSTRTLAYVDIDGFPRPQSTEMVFDDVDKRSKRVVTKTSVTFQWNELANEDEKRLSLPYYGFPEPKVKTHRTWWIIAGCLMILTAGYFIVLR